MQKIKKNLSAIQLKFQSLKQAHKIFEDPTPIGEAAQIMTYGVVRQQQVDQYLQHVHSAENIGQGVQINENWFQLNIQQMILFLDKVIKYRNFNKPKQAGKKERLNIVPYKKKKLKSLNKDTHQNPYVPRFMSTSIPENGQIQDPEQNGQLRKLNQNQRLIQIEQLESPYVSSEEGEEQNFVQKQSTSHSNDKQKIKQNIKADVELFIDLPQDFKSYPIEQRFIILLNKFSKNKNQLQKKFNIIYTHYKKEMYIPHQTFQTNSEILMDLRIFLKYYRDFDISKRFKTNQATSQFKRLAINGIWLDFQNFSQLHYRLIDMLKIKDKSLTSRLQHGQMKDNNKANQLKKQLSKNMKIIMQNLQKLNQLTELVSEQKIKKILNDQTGKKIITKIVEVHSGLVKQDILFRLRQRAQEKKKKNNLQLNDRFLYGNWKNLSPSKVVKSGQECQTRSSPGQLSVYQMLQIPTLSGREMKRSSVYSSLQLLKMHKEKERLKQLIDLEQNQKYLQAYFKKQRQLGVLFRSNSISLKRLDSLNCESPMNQALKSTQSAKSSRKDDFFLQNSLSLPRMKFS